VAATSALAEALARRKEENSLLLREDLARRATEFRGLPEVVALHTTERCNLRCVMCPRALGQGKLQLSRDRMAAVCDELFPTAKKVALSGAAGEPLLSDFDLVLERALAHGVRVDVVTNGTELTEALYRTAAPAFDHVNVSIDSHLPDVYERIRVGSRFERVDRNLRAITAARGARPDGVLLSLSAVVMRSTLPHFDGLVRYARELGVDGLILQRLSHSAKPTPEEDPFASPGAAAVGAALHGARATAAEVGLNLFASEFTAEFGVENLLIAPPRAKVPAELAGGALCSYLIQHFGVQPTGEVYPCCYPTDYVMGNVRFESPRAIWNSRAAQRLRAAHYARRPALFCAGCLHAPHLPPRGPRWWVDALRKGRMAVAYARNRRRRARLESRDVEERRRVAAQGEQPRG